MRRHPSSNHRGIQVALCALVVVAASLLLFPAGAGAQSCPPGNAGLDQYCESVQSGGGNNRSTGSGGSSGGNVPSGTQGALSDEGPAGEELLGAVGGGKGKKRRGNRDRAVRGAGGDQGSGNLFDGIGSAIEDGAGLGGWYAWGLLAIGVGLAGIAWLRYRRRVV
jgi:hypothetical protein